MLDFVNVITCEPFELRRCNFTGWKLLSRGIQPSGRSRTSSRRRGCQTAAMSHGS